MQRGLMLPHAHLNSLLHACFITSYIIPINDALSFMYLLSEKVIWRITAYLDVTYINWKTKNRVIVVEIWQSSMLG